MIELDGYSHDNEKSQSYDHDRTKELENYGLHIVRFTNEDIYHNIEAVLASIETYKKTHPI
ncbi:MAG: endonuclease domain-containing protein [Alphaproteobacteria bacterium]